MIDELDSLSARVAELVRLVHGLRDENQQLRARLAAAGAEHERLAVRVDAAAARIEALMAQMPVERDET